MLGIILTDFDVHNVPLLRTDQYGKFIPGPGRLCPGRHRHRLRYRGDWPAVWTLTHSSTASFSTNHAFLNDIAHHAAPGRVGLQW